MRVEVAISYIFVLKACNLCLKVPSFILLLFGTLEFIIFDILGVVI